MVKEPIENVWHGGKKKRVSRSLLLTRPLQPLCTAQRSDPDLHHSNCSRAPTWYQPYAFLIVGEAGALGGNPRRHRENMETRKSNRTQDPCCNSHFEKNTSQKKSQPGIFLMRNWGTVQSWSLWPDCSIWGTTDITDKLPVVLLTKLPPPSAPNTLCVARS